MKKRFVTRTAHILCVVGLTGFGLFGFVSYSLAQSMMFWRDSVLSEFSAEDVASFKRTIKETLEKSPDTKVIEWKSSSSDLAGKILPKLSFESNGQSCRRTAFQVTQGKSRKEQYRFDVCKGKDGWTIVEPVFKLNSAERKDLQVFVEHVLDAEEDGFPNYWKGSKSNNSVVMVPLEKTENDAGQTCRIVAVVLTAGNSSSANGKYNFCKTNNGWDYQP